MPKSSRCTLPWRVDQDVRRLEVAMHDQCAMRIRDRAGDLRGTARRVRARRACARGNRRRSACPRCTPSRVRPAVVGDAGVVEARDVRMLQRREDLALAASRARSVSRAPTQCGSFSATFRRMHAVGALRQPHRAHAAFADRASSRYGPTTPPTDRRDGAIAAPRSPHRRRLLVKRARSFRKSSVSCSACFCSRAERVGLSRVLEASSAASQASRWSAGSSRPVCSSARTSLRSPGAKFCMRAEAGAGFVRPCVLHGSRRLLNPPEWPATPLEISQPAGGLRLHRVRAHHCRHSLQELP